jgi:para-aminobenzoate synthetase component 2
LIFILDNYDSFSYNLFRYIKELGQDVWVERNDSISLEEVEKKNPDKIIISPGPCSPKEAGLSNDMIRHFQYKKPILGVCLGHQCIAHVFGGRVKKAKAPVHGKTDPIYHNKKGLFKTLPSPLSVMRYHSLIIDDLPSDLIVTATSATSEEIMAIQHKRLPIFGVQFHPESILSKSGHDLLQNFLNI